jgi:heat shock protein HtpX
MNRIKTLMFLALLTALLFWIGQVLAGQVGLLVALMFTELMNFGTYWWLDKIV